MTKVESSGGRAQALPLQWPEIWRSLTHCALASLHALLFGKLLPSARDGHDLFSSFTSRNFRSASAREHSSFAAHTTQELPGHTHNKENPHKVFTTMADLHEDLAVRGLDPGTFLTSYKGLQPVPTPLPANIIKAVSTTTDEAAVAVTTAVPTSIPASELPYLSEGWIVVIVITLVFLSILAAMAGLWISEEVALKRAYNKLSPDGQRRWRRKEYLDARYRAWKHGCEVEAENDIDRTPEESRVSTPVPQANRQDQVATQQLKQRLSKVPGVFGADDIDLERQEIHRGPRAITPPPRITAWFNKLIEPHAYTAPLFEFASCEPSDLNADLTRTYPKQQSPSGLSCFEKYGAYPDSITTSAAEPLLPKHPDESLDDNQGFLIDIGRGVEGLARMLAERSHAEVGDDPEEGLILPVRDEEREGFKAAKRIHDLEQGL